MTERTDHVQHLYFPSDMQASGSMGHEEKGRTRKGAKRRLEKIDPKKDKRGKKKKSEQSSDSEGEDKQEGA